MAEKTEIAVSLMPKLEDKIVELSGRLEQVMQERAPEAWDAALKVVQVEAVRDVVYGTLFVVTAITVLIVTRMLYRKAVEYVAENPRDNGCQYALATAGVLIGITTLAIGFARLLDAWTWTALFSPELVIAKRIMAGVL